VYQRKALVTSDQCFVSSRAPPRIGHGNNEWLAMRSSQLPINELTGQQGYAAFSVRASLVRAVVRYIQTQKSHHRKMSFDAEFLALLKKHGLEFDLRFVFGQVPRLRRFL
jgi:hypothetical protein